MRRVLWVLFPLVLFVSAAQPVFAGDLSFITGEKLNHTLSVCLDKQDALDILAADEKMGKEAAEAVWQSKPRCGNIDVAGGQVGKVVKSIKTTRGGQPVITSAVEIVHNGQIVAYFLTTSPVNKAQRNS